eukprot:CAMPEP_0206588358 /NCGR_PEP_ID=MMETSP0325_2-20121206/38231_1 /ASSEMBLY_ACC=CAM_ASM_000347 /TAXON_ID=2866 /ORGANISM="Crypthecodinium cohnii, Strain Seligo" /LENGTH=159 /DNA_ID=CAMNT_0054096613 /DNA_START=139 /DNA_END=618 /DNA_ORIENTATION=+
MMLDSSDLKLQKKWNSMVQERCTAPASDEELDAVEAEIFDYIRQQHRWPTKTSDPRSREWQEWQFAVKEDLEVPGIDVGSLSSSQIRALADQHLLETMENEIDQDLDKFHKEQAAKAAQEAEERRPERVEAELEALESEIWKDLEDLKARCGNLGEEKF